ncbi:MAG: hypothetical protein SGPRY_006855, partial [Prymnesium sp.]
MYDEEGRRSIAINDASRTYRRPQWLEQHADSEVRRWDRERYRHVRWTDGEEAQHAPVKYKFPKETKPSLSDFLRDLTILAWAAKEMNEPIFVWVEDAAYYFNQFGYAPEELWKSTFVVGAREGDQDALGEHFHAGQLIFVSEDRLGFGSFASSNIAQRFSNAIVRWTLEEFDRLEHTELQQVRPSPTWTRWVTNRRQLEARCRRERRRRQGTAE